MVVVTISMLLLPSFVAAAAALPAICWSVLDRRVFSSRVCFRFLFGGRWAAAVVYDEKTATEDDALDSVLSEEEGGDEGPRYYVSRTTK